MGNCQAIDSATLEIQHPSGKVERLYWAVSANEIMKMNPGHYVALLISTTISTPNDACDSSHSITNSVRFTRIKLLRPSDTLVLGQVYRLISSQEVMKCLLAKKQAKMKKKQAESAGPDSAVRRTVQDDNQVKKHEKNRSKTSTSTHFGTARSRTWQPSLQSISEAAI